MTTTNPTTVGPPSLEDAGDVGLWTELYRRMVLVRRFEDMVQALFQKGLVHGTTHLYSGEEAGAVGVGSVLAAQDRVAGTYRGHGHALGLGVSPQALMDEMLGRSTGVCGGRAGSMNVIDLENRLIGCFGIIGGSISAATGAAMALQRVDGVAVAYFGDGTTNHGYFHECLNFAKVRNLPVLFYCENNGYGEFTPMAASTAGAIRSRPEALEIPSVTIDGNDIQAVREAAGAAVARAREGGGPQFIEGLTYRFVGHSRSDPGAYRPEGELEEKRKHDPLLVARRQLTEQHGVSVEALDAIDADVDAELETVRERAIAAPFPEATQIGREFAPAA